MKIKIDSNGYAATTPKLIKGGVGYMHGCLSKGIKEKMTHSNTPVYVNGVLYCIYIFDEVTTLEWKQPTAGIRLSAKSTISGITEFYDVATPNAVIGNLTIDNYPPYDPNLVVSEDKKFLLCYFVVKPNTTHKETVCYRKYDLEKQELLDEVTICKLDGETFTNEKACSVYNSLTGKNVTMYEMNMSCTITKFSDGYYYTGVGGDGGFGFGGLVIRSQDLINWDTVTQVTAPRDDTRCTELAVFEDENNRMLVAARYYNMGIYYGIYHNSSWIVTPSVIRDTIATRPEFFKYEDNIYLSVCVNGSITTEGYGTVERATLGIFKVVGDRVELNTKLQCKYGIHYQKALVIDGDLFLAYSTDERMLDASQSRSNIAFDRIIL